MRKTDVPDTGLPAPYVPERWCREHVIMVFASASGAVMGDNVFMEKVGGVPFAP